jgi:hypothetical protein
VTLLRPKSTLVLGTERLREVKATVQNSGLSYAGN